MRFSPDDREKLERLGVDDLLSLALIVPTQIEDHHVRDTLEHNALGVIDAEVLTLVRTPKTLRIHFFAHNLDRHVEGVIFNPRWSMGTSYPIGTRARYKGKITIHGDVIQMIQPTKITLTTNTLVPRYKCALRSDVMRRVMGRYLTYEALLEEGLPSGVAEGLCAIHFPDRYRVEEAAQTYALKYTELYRYMRRLRQHRRYYPNHYVPQGDLHRWITQLPFALTRDQLRAIEEIAADLHSPYTAKRMIVGEVGSGKSVVMFACAVMMAPHRTLLMAPTSILAQQLYDEACRLVPQLRCALVMHKKDEGILHESHLIIGTHALLHRDLPEVALVMIDEQHRFGTAQRQALHTLIDNVHHAHSLQFSATPIPRTQALIESAHIDVSLIVHTPFEKEVTTHVIGKSDFPALMSHIHAQIAQSHQVLIVYPLVESSEMIQYQSLQEARGFWEQRFERVYVTHGKDREKEATVRAFKESGDLLLATTVVEVGISLPRLSTVVIVGAERLGLATLHQLRGRVSRMGLRGYCYLYTTQPNPKRLEAFCTTMSGFEIAELDLQWRESGDLLSGRAQSGRHWRWVDLVRDHAIVQAVRECLPSSPDR